MNGISVYIDFHPALAKKEVSVQCFYVIISANFDFAKRSAVREPVKVHVKGVVLGV